MDWLSLFLTLTLVRGLGQGALSVVSMAMVGKWFTRRLPVAMGVFTILLTIGMVVSVSAVGASAHDWGWRGAWIGVGLFLLAIMAPLGLLLVRNTPESIGVAVDRDSSPVSKRIDASLSSALTSPAFWAFTLAMCLFNLAWSAITLFYENLLEHQGLDHATYMKVMGVLMATGLPTNLFAGWLATRWPLGRLLALGMALLGLALAVFPLVETDELATLFGAVFGISGGIITVVWFSVYGKSYGRENLGAIQAVAQVLSVFASALGPMLLTWTFDGTGSYDPVFYLCAPLAGVLALAVWLVRLPSAEGERGS
jgi:MFS family permease